MRSNTGFLATQKVLSILVSFALIASTPTTWAAPIVAQDSQHKIAAQSRVQKGPEGQLGADLEAYFSGSAGPNLANAAAKLVEEYEDPDTRTRKLLTTYMVDPYEIGAQRIDIVFGHSPEKLQFHLTVGGKTALISVERKHVSIGAKPRGTWDRVRGKKRELGSFFLPLQIGEGPNAKKIALIYWDSDDEGIPEDLVKKIPLFFDGTPPELLVTRNVSEDDRVFGRIVWRRESAPDQSARAIAKALGVPVPVVQKGLKESSPKGLKDKLLQFAPVVAFAALIAGCGGGHGALQIPSVIEPPIPTVERDVLSVAPSSLATDVFLPRALDASGRAFFPQVTPAQSVGEAHRIHFASVPGTNATTPSAIELHVPVSTITVGGMQQSISQIVEDSIAISRDARFTTIASPYSTNGQSLNSVRLVTHDRLNNRWVIREIEESGILIEEISDVALTPSGSHLLLAFRTGTIKIYEVQTGKSQIVDIDKSLESLGIHQIGDIGVGSQGGRLFIREAPESQPLGSDELVAELGISDLVGTLGIAPNILRGNPIIDATLPGGPAIKVYRSEEAPSYIHVEVVRGDQTDTYELVAGVSSGVARLDSNGNVLTIASADGRLHQVNLSTGTITPLGVPATLSAQGRQVVFSRGLDGNLIARLQDSQGALIGNPIAIPDHAGVAVSDGLLGVFGPNSNQLYLLSDGRFIDENITFGDTLVTPGGLHVRHASLAGGRETLAVVTDPVSGEVVSFVKVSGNYVADGGNLVSPNGIFSPNGRYYVFATVSPPTHQGDLYKIVVVDLQDGSHRAITPDPNVVVGLVGFSVDDVAVLLTGVRLTPQSYRLDTGERVDTVGVPSMLRSRSGVEVTFLAATPNTLSAVIGNNANNLISVPRGSAVRIVEEVLEITQPDGTIRRVSLETGVEISQPTLPANVSREPFQFDVQIGATIISNALSPVPAQSVPFGTYRVRARTRDVFARAGTNGWTQVYAILELVDGNGRVVATRHIRSRHTTGGATGGSGGQVRVTGFRQDGTVVLTDTHIQGIFGPDLSQQVSLNLTSLFPDIPAQDLAFTVPQGITVSEDLRFGIRSVPADAPTSLQVFDFQIDQNIGEPISLAGTLVSTPVFSPDKRRAVVLVQDSSTAIHKLQLIDVFAGIPVATIDIGRETAFRLEGENEVLLDGSERIGFISISNQRDGTDVPTAGTRIVVGEGENEQRFEVASGRPVLDADIGETYALPESVEQQGVTTQFGNLQVTYGRFHTATTLRIAGNAGSTTETDTGFIVVRGIDNQLLGIKLLRQQRPDLPAGILIGPTSNFVYSLTMRIDVTTGRVSADHEFEGQAPDGAASNPIVASHHLSQLFPDIFAIPEPTMVVSTETVTLRGGEYGLALDHRYDGSTVVHMRTSSGAELATGIMGPGGRVYDLLQDAEGRKIGIYDPSAGTFSIYDITSYHNIGPRLKTTITSLSAPQTSPDGNVEARVGTGPRGHWLIVTRKDDPNFIVATQLSGFVEGKQRNGDGSPMGDYIGDYYVLMSADGYPSAAYHYANVVVVDGLRRGQHGKLPGISTFGESVQRDWQIRVVEDELIVDAAGHASHRYDLNRWQETLPVVNLIAPPTFPVHGAVSRFDEGNFIVEMYNSDGQAVVRLYDRETRELIDESRIVGGEFTVRYGEPSQATSLAGIRRVPQADGSTNLYIEFYRYRRVGGDHRNNPVRTEPESIGAVTLEELFGSMDRISEAAAAPLLAQSSTIISSDGTVIGGPSAGPRVTYDVIATALPSVVVQDIVLPAGYSQSSVSADGQRVVALNVSNSTMVVLDAQTKQVLQSIHLGQVPSVVAANQDGSYAVVGIPNGTVLVNLETGQVTNSRGSLQKSSEDRTPTMLKLHPSGKYVFGLAGSELFVVDITDPQNPRQASTRNISNHAKDFHFSDNGSSIVLLEPLYREMAEGRHRGEHGVPIQNYRWRGDNIIQISLGDLDIDLSTIDWENPNSLGSVRYDSLAMDNVSSWVEPSHPAVIYLSDATPDKIRRLGVGDVGYNRIVLLDVLANGQHDYVMVTGVSGGEKWKFSLNETGVVGLVLARHNNTPYLLSLDNKKVVRVYTLNKDNPVAVGSGVLSHTPLAVVQIPGKPGEVTIHNSDGTISIANMNTVVADLLQAAEEERQQRLPSVLPVVEGPHVDVPPDVSPTSLLPEFTTPMAGGLLSILSLSPMGKRVADTVSPDNAPLTVPEDPKDRLRRHMVIDLAFVAEVLAHEDPAKKEDWSQVISRSAEFKRLVDKIRTVAGDSVVFDILSPYTEEETETLFRLANVDLAGKGFHRKIYAQGLGIQDVVRDITIEENDRLSQEKVEATEEEIQKRILFLITEDWAGEEDYNAQAHKGKPYQVLVGKKTAPLSKMVYGGLVLNNKILTASPDEFAPLLEKWYAANGLPIPEEFEMPQTHAEGIYLMPPAKASGSRMEHYLQDRKNSMEVKIHA